MLKGKRVSIKDPLKLKLFYPKSQYITQTPILSGSYIYEGENFDLKKFPTSIWVTKRRPDFDLNTPSVILLFISYAKKFPTSVVERIKEETEVEAMWAKIIEFLHFGRLLGDQEEPSIYNLFRALGRSDKEIYNEYVKIKAPRQVVLSSILTMISKAQSYQEYQGTTSNSYLKQLRISSQVLRNVKAKFIEYCLSDKTELRFLKLLFDLKR